MSPDWSAKAEPVPYAKLDNPQSLNLYAYVGNNPLRATDPDGHADDPCKGNKICTSSTTSMNMTGKDTQITYQKTTTVVTNADGSKTTTSTVTYVSVSTKEGEGGKFDRATQRVTSSTVDAKGNPVGKSSDSGVRQLGEANAVKAIGAEAYGALVNQGAKESAPGFTGETAKDYKAHPAKYWAAAAGVGVAVVDPPATIGAGVRALVPLVFSLWDSVTGK